MIGYLQLLRPVNCAMTVLAVAIGGLLASPFAFFSFPIWAAMVIAFVIAGAGNAINDYVDVEADKINRPGRPLPAGKASASGVLIFSLLLFFGAIFISSLINFLVFVIAVINSALLVLYSFRLKNKFLIGNLAIAWLVGSAFLFGAAAVGSLLLAAWLALLAGLATVAREIVKDLQDFEGDKKGFLAKIKLNLKKIKFGIFDRFGLTSKGMVVLKHKSGLLVSAIVFLLLAVLISPLPYLQGLLSVNYLVAVVITDLIFLACVVAITQKRSWGKISKAIKIGMFFGLLAFIVGIF
jgi:geranylgeranylglycerol-phosphate geranylgeranyltransferase